MADLRTFARRMRNIGTKVQHNSDALVRKVAIAIDSAVVLATPVDTGRARSNWQVEINAPAAGAIDAHYPGKEGSTQGQNAQKALDLGREKIDEYKTGSTIHITNNLPYIGRLNDGYSAQAPVGFVESAVLVGVATIQGAGSLTSDDIQDES